MPKNLKPAEREPYEANDIAKIIAACDAIGRGPDERLRARAMVLLLRYTALPISDVATLGRSRIRDGEILVRTTKSGKPVKLPVHADLQATLDVLPVPRGGGQPGVPVLLLERPWISPGGHSRRHQGHARPSMMPPACPGPAPIGSAIPWRLRFWRWVGRPPLASLPRRLQLARTAFGHGYLHVVSERCGEAKKKEENKAGSAPPSHADHQMEGGRRRRARAPLPGAFLRTKENVNLLRHRHSV